MKKLFFALLIIGGVIAAVNYWMRRSEGSYEDTWETFADMGSKVRDRVPFGKAA
jgi:hypothetical protein